MNWLVRLDVFQENKKYTEYNKEKKMTQGKLLIKKKTIFSIINSIYK